MEFGRMIGIALAMWAGLFSQAAFAQNNSDDIVETYNVEFRVKGEPVYVQVSLLPESPLDNPNFKQEIQELHVDHVLFVEDEPEQVRAPSAEGDFEQAKALVQEAGVDVESVTPKKGFFKAMTGSFGEIFRNKKNKPGKSDLNSALISVFTGRLSSVGMVVAKHNLSLMSGVMLFLAQGTLTFVDNYFNYPIRSYLKDNWFRPGIREEARVVTQITRGLIYKMLFLEIAKSFEPSFLTAATQSNILGNALITTPLEVLIANRMIHAFTGTPKEVVAKVAKVNMVLFGVGSALSIVDQVGPHGMKLFSIAAYDFKYSGLALLLYYGYSFYKLKNNPEKVLKWCVAVNDGAARILSPITTPLGRVANWADKKLFKPVGGWIKARLGKCERVFQDQGTPSDNPTLNSDNEAPST